MTHQVLEQRELRLGELHRPITAGHLAGGRVERQVRVAELLSGVAVRPPEQRPQPREQLLERERLDDVVVGAGVEAVDPVLDGVPGGQHQDRSAVAAGAKLARDLQAVALGHQHVQDDGVHRRRRDRAEGLLAIRRQLDLVALELQGPLERSAELRFVIHHQYAHVLMLPRSHKNMMRAGWTSVE